MEVERLELLVLVVLVVILFYRPLPLLVVVVEAQKMPMVKLVVPVAAVVEQHLVVELEVLEPLIKDMLAAMAHLVVQQEVVLVVVALAQ